MFILPHQRTRVRDAGDEGEDLRGVDRRVGRRLAVVVEFRLVGPFFVQEKQRRVVVRLRYPKRIATRLLSRETRLLGQKFADLADVVGLRHVEEDV